jgi:peptide deformylase
MAALWQTRNRDIVKLGDPALRSIARPVGRPTSETRALVERMKAAMKDDHGMGLAAPQLGVAQRVIIYRLPEDGAPLRVIVDPRIVSAKGEQIGTEGCLSLPFLHGDVTRASEIVVKGTDMLGRTFRRRASEVEARVIQHEVDHLDGILFIDRADPAALHWSVPEDASLARQAAPTG